MVDTKPIYILLMEDDAGMARLFQKKLTQAGYAVDIARNGEEGLVMYEAGAYDVVAVDQKMPIYDGLTVLRLLAERGPLLPTIMVTGHGDEATAAEAMKLGAWDYIVKDVAGGYLELLPIVIEQVLQQQRLLKTKQQAEEALRQSEARYRLLAENSLDLIGLLDLQGNIIYASPSHFQVLGYSPNKLCGENVFTLIHPDGKQSVLSAVDALFISGQSQTLEIRLQKKRANWLIVEAILAGIADSFNTVNRILLSARDITRRKQAEEALRQYTAELQTRNEELDAFAHTVAHDLKGPIGVIIGFTELLEQDHEGGMSAEELGQYLHLIARNGRKIHSIIEELLTLATVRKTDVRPAELDMARIAAEVQQRLAYMIAEHQAEIIWPNTWPLAIGHGPWVEEVWTNYLSNAIKYGGRPPRIELGADPPADGMARFWVRDNGRGVKPEDRANLFTPFTQLKQIRGEGQGLGLSIVRRIAEKLGGQVGVESEPGLGSTFWFTLPSVEA